MFRKSLVFLSCLCILSSCNPQQAQLFTPTPTTQNSTITAVRTVTPRMTSTPDDPCQFFDPFSIPTNENIVFQDGVLAQIGTEDYCNISGKTLAFNPDASLLALANGDGVRIYSTLTGELVQFFPTEGEYSGVWSVVFSPDGRYIASVTTIGQINVWDTETGLLVISLMPRFRDTSSLGITSHTIMFSEDGTQLITSCTGNRIENIRIWGFPGGDLLNTYDIPLYNYGLITHDGEHIIIAEVGGWNIYDINTMEITLSSAEEDTISFIQFSPDNQIIYTNSWYTAQVTAWDATTGERIYTFGECDDYCHAEGPMDAYVRFGLSNDGRRLAVIDAFYGTISVWDTQTRALIQSFDPEGSVYDVVISGDGTMVAALTYSHETGYRRIWIWHLLP